MVMVLMNMPIMFLTKPPGVIETTVDVKFDESNGSQVEQVDMNLVDDEEPPSISIMRMA